MKSVCWLSSQFSPADLYRKCWDNCTPPYVMFKMYVDFLYLTCIQADSYEKPLFILKIHLVIFIFYNPENPHTGFNLIRHMPHNSIQCWRLASYHFQYHTIVTMLNLWQQIIQMKQKTVIWMATKCTVMLLTLVNHRVHTRSHENKLSSGQ